MGKRKVQLRSSVSFISSFTIIKMMLKPRLGATRAILCCHIWRKAQTQQSKTALYSVFFWATSNQKTNYLKH